MQYCRRNSYDSAGRAFERGYGYCMQHAYALADLLTRLGFETRVVQAFENEFADGTITSHAWVRVTLDGETRAIDPLFWDEGAGRPTFTPLSRVTHISPLFKAFTWWGAPAARSTASSFARTARMTAVVAANHGRACCCGSRAITASASRAFRPSADDPDRDAWRDRQLTRMIGENEELSNVEMSYAFKLLMDEFVERAGVELRFFNALIDVAVEGREIDALIVSGKERLYALRAPQRFLEMEGARGGRRVRNARKWLARIRARRKYFKRRK